MDEQPNQNAQRSASGQVSKVPRRELSAAELESGLTDICAEIYFLEAERVRTGRLLSDLKSGDRLAEGDASEPKRLLRQRSLIEGRLEELEARAAGLRAQVERARARQAG